MRTLALTLFAIGGVIFAFTVIYCGFDKLKTGITFRNKKMMFPPLIISWLIAISGMLILALNQEG